ncbi:hypothetical protein ACFW04_001856 [Cataglyphis niger]
MRRASPGRGSRHRLCFAGRAMMAECAADRVHSIVRPIDRAHARGWYARRNNRCENGTTLARAEVDRSSRRGT